MPRRCMEVEPSVAHKGYFEADVDRNGSNWFCVVWDKFWDEMLPGLELSWEEKRARRGRITKMPFTREEVEKVILGYKDAEGKIYVQNQTCMFKRCRCVDANGERRVCVPPQPGWMCRRKADMFKMHAAPSGNRRILRGMLRGGGVAATPRPATWIVRGGGDSREKLFRGGGDSREK